MTGALIGVVGRVGRFGFVLAEVQPRGVEFRVFGLPCRDVVVETDATFREDVAQIDDAGRVVLALALAVAPVVHRQLLRHRERPAPPVRGLRQAPVLDRLGDRVADDSFCGVEKQVLPVLNTPLRHGDLGALGCAATSRVSFVQRHRPVQSGKGECWRRQVSRSPTTSQTASWRRRRRCGSGDP